MNRLIKILFALSLIFITAFTLDAKTVRLRFQIRNAAGEPVVGASVVSGQGVSAKSDDKGFCEIQMDDKDYLVITDKSQNTITVTPDEISGSDDIIVLDTFNETAYMAFDSYIEASKMTSVPQARRGEELTRYPSLDIPNALTGMFTGLTVNEVSASAGSKYNADKVNVWGRGLQNVSWMLNGLVTGMPSNLSCMQLDPEQIESVTYVKNPLDKARFGPNGTNGVLNVKLREGYYGPLRVTVSVESGVSTPDRFPGFVNGYDYATLNNIARVASGFSANYSDEQLQGFKANDPNSLEYPSVDYRSLLFRNYRHYNRANIDFNGGNDILRYNAYLGYSNEDELFKVGEASDFHRFNVGSTLNARLSRYISVDVSAKGTITLQRAPIVGSETTSEHPINDILTELLDVTPVDFPIYAVLDESAESADIDDVKKFYAVSNRYGNNPYADLAERGKTMQKGFDVFLSNSLNWDMSHWLKGLKSQTWFGMDLYYRTNIGMNPNYVAYIWEGAGNPIKTISPSHKGAKATSYSSYNTKYYDVYSASQKFSFTRDFGVHHVDLSLSGQIQHIGRVAKSTYERQMNLIGSASYSYKDKYIVDFVGNYDGSMMFVKGNRFRFLPSFGAAWVASKEDFMQGGPFSYLKFFAQYGTLAYEDYANPYRALEELTRSTFGGFGPSENANKWFGSTNEASAYRTNFNRYGNPSLTYEVRKELAAGVEMGFLGNRLTAEATYFHNVRDGIIAEVNGLLPGVFGISGVDFYDNYNVYTYYGAEFGLNWKDKVGDFTYSIGANGIYNDGTIDRYNEVITYENLATTGRHHGDILGYVYQGRYTDEADVAASAVNTLGAVKPGDFKYADIVKDDVINSNDRQVIGNNKPKLCYSVNLYLNYKGLDLAVVGTGQAFKDVVLNNEYYWSGFGDGAISNYVLQNYNNPDKYPALEYVRNTNNFQTSAFWLAKGGFFKIQNVELGYQFKFRNTSAVKGLRVYARGANLLTISGIKDCDPESLNSGVTTSPLYRTTTLGLQFKF